MKSKKSVDKTEKDFISYIKSEKKIEPQREALKIALSYGVFGVLWILLSDKIIHFFTEDLILLRKIELYKGWLYVAITVLIVYGLIKNRLTLFKIAMKRIVETYEELSNAHKTLVEQNKLKQKLREAQEISDNIFQNAPIIIALSDLEGKLVKINKYAEEILGYSNDEFGGALWIKKLIPEKHRVDFEQIFEKQKSGQLVTNFEGELLCKNGQEVNMFWKCGFLYNEYGSIKEILYMGIDVTNLKTVEKRLNYISYYNPLTRLPNRAWFEEQANSLLNFKYQLNDKMALVYLDIDNFKYINDILGHNFGDKIIQHIGNILKNQVQQPDIISHIGGDDFVILFSSVIDIENKIEYIQKVLSHPWVLDKQEIFITTSAGAALFPDHGNDLLTLMKNAETAMYCTKETQKGSYSFYSEVFANRALEFIWMVNELRKAIKNEEFILYYQPLIDLQSGIIAGVEVLIRWNHPVKGWISPGEFIPIAEASGLILDIGKWVFENACKQKKMWNDKGHSNIKMSINLSCKEFAKRDLLLDIEQIIDKFNLDYSSIQIEITESIALADFHTAVKTLEKLKTLGLKVALDDFGTGYSSLNYLKELPIDVIKLDGSFIKSIENEDEEEEIINTVIQLGHILNTKIVAEGIETKDQLKFLIKHKCDTGQGYLFSKPLPAEEIEILLQSNKRYI